MFTSLVMKREYSVRELQYLPFNAELVSEIIVFNHAKLQKWFGSLFFRRRVYIKLKTLSAKQTGSDYTIKNKTNISQPSL